MTVMKDKDLYSVKEICIMYNITRKTLFYYDRIGLLKPAVRQGIQRFKYYDVNSLNRLERIRVFRDAGLNISEIREVLDLSDKDSIIKLLNSVKARLEEEKHQKEKELGELNRLISFLKTGTMICHQKNDIDCSLGNKDRVGGDIYA